MTRPTQAQQLYSLMTRAERRVAIAKDVIKQLNKFGKIVKSTGYYHGPKVKELNKRQAKQVIPRCTVCARGAMALCRIAKFNGITLDASLGHLYQDDTTKALEDAFTKNQLNKIENAFEGYWTPDQESHKLRKFFQQHQTSPERLQAIMQNIIDNKGTFKP